MRDRIPFLFAALLVAGLVGVLGIAAFSINRGEETPQEETYEGVISGRVASAVLAVSVSATDAEPLPTATVEAFVPQAVEVEPVTTTEAPSTADTTPPSLVITSPDDRATVTTSVVEFTGTSEREATVASGPFAATMAENGDWSIKLVVSAGYNSTVFTATDLAGNESSVRIVVFYEPPTTTTTKPQSTTTTKVQSTTTTKAPSTTTTTTPEPPPSNCPIAGSCSPSWPADPKGSHGREFWRPQVEQHWQADRVECVLDLIQVESTGNPQARSKTGAYLGLLQHSYWDWNRRAEAIGMVDGDGLTAHPYNGAANIAAGAWLADNSDPWWRPWPPTGRIASCQALGA